MATYDLAVLGGGPAGYVGAIRAAQLGKKVIVIEKERAGGTCLNWGCIPSKSLLKNAEIYQHILHADEYGITTGKVSFDFAKVIGRSRNVSDRIAKGVEFLLKAKKVDYLVGEGKLGSDRKIKVKTADGKSQVIEATNVLLATGCVPRVLPGLKVDGKVVMTSREALEMKKQPKSIVILGAGAIGVEFAYFLHSFGTKVTLVEMKPRVLPIEDEEISDMLGKNLAKQGIEILSETSMESVTNAKTIEADALLCAVGVQANLEGALDAGVKLELDRGYVKTDARYKTSMAGVFAAGDIIGPPWLAHVASFEAIEAVNGIFDPKYQPKKVTTFPGCTYCQPQVASIGLTEAAAKEKKLKFKVGRFPYRASGRAVASGDSEGMVKILIGEPHGEILGAHIIGAEATELIAEVGLGMTLEATADEIAGTIHAHPTLTEMIKEATEAAAGHAIHI
ncbi:MAG: dihydrolipoyl dehydrogenase [Verrucomicrobia bacterium]|nr:dihydrolipoyl dehydrogenase [Verrucomicrobiota bacterium]